MVQAELERQLGTSCEPVDWLPGYFRLRGDVKIAGTEAYRAGHVYGIDAASGAAVVALGHSNCDGGPKPDHNPDSDSDAGPLL